MQILFQVSYNFIQDLSNMFLKFIVTFIPESFPGISTNIIENFLKNLVKISI